MIAMSEEEIKRFLNNTLVGRLAMASCEGQPYAIPMPFCWHEGALYLRLPNSGRKGQILEENNKVCFEVDEYTLDLSDYCSVLIEGKLVFVEDLDEKKTVREVNEQKYNRLRGTSRKGHGRITPFEDLPIRKLIVSSISGRKKE